jgi:ADP-ribosylglycohydrolase
MSSRDILRDLLDRDLIDIQNGPLFDTVPEPLPRDLDFGKIEGMMLGLAVGDALGNSSEGRLPGQRRVQFGEIRDYLPNGYLGGRRAGTPSDDSQLAFWTLEQLLADRGFVPDHAAARFCRQQIFGIGASVRQFIINYKTGTTEWYRCGPKSAGNGALMRIAPILIPHLKSAGTELWADTALSAMITHNDSASIASCLAVARMLWQLLPLQTPPEPVWWAQSFMETARQLERDERYTPRGGRFTAYRGPLWRYVQERVPAALAQDLPVLEACQSWLSGAFLFETVPCVLYILARHAHSFEEAVVRAVNDTKDNDTIAAIVGALAGALHGKAGIPKRWLANLTGRTGKDDDGRMFLLLDQARETFELPAFFH